MQTSIIVLSYNRIDLLEKCLIAIIKNISADTEVIVVDNGSTENIPNLVKNRFPEAKLISLKKNTGFATGNNIGMKSSKGKYFILINTDAFLEAGVIKTLVQFMETHPDAGAVGPQLHNVDGTIQPSGGFFPHLFQVFLIMTFIDNLPVIRRFAPSIHIRDKNYFTRTRQMEWIMGAFLLIRREVFKQTGGFDQNIFMYGEELEWCYRIHKDGWNIYLTPEVSVVHLGHASSPSEGFGIIKEMESFLNFYKKHKPKWQLPILIILIFTGCFLRIFRGIVTLNKEMATTYVLALKTVSLDIFNSKNN